MRRTSTTTNFIGVEEGNGLDEKSGVCTGIIFFEHTVYGTWSYLLRGSVSVLSVTSNNFFSWRFLDRSE